MRTNLVGFSAGISLTLRNRRCGGTVGRLAEKKETVVCQKVNENKLPPFLALYTGIVGGAGKSSPHTTWNVIIVQK